MTEIDPGTAAAIAAMESFNPDLAFALKYMRLTYSLTQLAMDRQESGPEDYPQEWSIEAFIEDYDGNFPDLPHNHDGAIKIGEAALCVVPDVGDISLFMTLDAIDSETFGFAEALIAAGSPARGRGIVLNGESIDGDLVLLSSVHVIPEFRGHRVGHAILQGALRVIGRNAGLVMLQAAPVLSDGDAAEGSLAHKRVSRALVRYWGELGFRVLNDGYMVLEPHVLEGLLAPDMGGIDDDEFGSEE